MSLNIQLNIILYHGTWDIVKNLNIIQKRNQLNLYNIKSKLRFNLAVYSIKIVLDSKLKRMKSTHTKAPFFKIFKEIHLFSSLIILSILTRMT